ncbi:MAG TPA: arsenate reductase ArsC [Ignavibacteria bacterium]|nr:arsenate reductase ArsC [Ignavibacteria bacterium]HQY52293.1 arsenate reductase ArsC [Ignavibacteria bacterium]HRA99877.1 arsenate reductase ArsC [Ignavibacteria bacterium]
MNKKILILCTGNSCRSQMAEGFLRDLDKDLGVYSAGTFPAEKVNPNSIVVMNEIGIDISANKPNDVSDYVNENFDYVITVCDNAKEICPVFTGNVKHRLHLGFIDPAEAKGTPEEILQEYRDVRDEIKSTFRHFYNTKLKDN